MLLVLAAGCAPDGGLSVHNSAPAVSIVSPPDGTTLAAGAALRLDATVDDAQSQTADLDLTFTVDNGSVLEGELTISDGSVVLLAEGLPAGDHTVTLVAVDEQGESGADSVLLHMVEDEVPTVSFVTPGEGDRLPAGAPVRVELLAADADEADLSDLVLTWGDAASGSTSAPASPDSSGVAAFYLTELAVGAQIVSVTVTDTLGATGSAAVAFTVVESDSDGDGHDDTAWGGDDCDDGDASVYPGADEACDGVDHDCDGAVDEDDATDAPTWYADTDGDGHGDAADTARSCDLPSGYVADDADCDDADAGVYPGADEACDGVDHDCDGLTDEDDAIDSATWYADVDGDGHGDAGSTTSACDLPSGYVADATDCDDTNGAVYPSASERCNSIDDDCDGTTDEDDAVDAPAWYLDGDGDGSPGATTTQSCTQPSGTGTSATDCDDGNAAVFPGADEWCNAVDDDCDGTVDEDDALDAATWYIDADGDGYGHAGTTTAACDLPSGFAATDTDCDDTDALFNPGASETDCADPNDYNCDGSTGYADADADGWVACEECDDTVAAVNPDATEVCNGEDDDCDGTTDEDDAADALTWYADTDADGYGSASVTDVACAAPSGYVASATDCNDARALSNPAATEYCNSYDDDCDGTTDEDAAVDAATWYLDADGDGYGTTSATDVACSQPSGYAAVSTDCNDARALSNPGATEYCNTYDDDCDGTTDEDAAADATTWYADTDGDGYGNAAVSDVACSVPSGYVASSTDCNDARALSNPAATEYCNSYDDDCDGTTDEDAAIDALTWYRDADADGYGSASVTDVACTAPSGYVASATDCDDAASSVNPGGSEVCDASDTDEDCDGLVDDADASVSAASESTWYLDADGDDYGSTSSTAQACDVPSGYGSATDDCDDGNASVNPDATETCDGVDNDCDGTVDFVDEDLDADGYSTCDLDCDDTDASVHPGMLEVCGNGADDDCDGTTDGGDSDGDGYDGCGAEDCNDWSDLVYPGATEITDDRMDNDCDGTVDDEGVDDDEDGYTENAGDCDDAAPWIGPGAVEIPDTEVDEDCDGAEEYAIDWSSTAIFVDADLGSDYFPGTQEYPVATLGRGVTLAARAGTSVVAAEGTYVENVSASVHIFGGYAADWSTASGLSVVEGSLTYPSAASGVVVSGLEIDGVVEAVGDGIFYGGAVYADSSEAWAADSSSGSLGIAESLIMGPETYTSGDIATVVIGADGGWVYDSAVLGGVGGDGADGAAGSGTTLVSTYRPWDRAECDGWEAPQGNDGSSGTDGAAVVSWKVVDGGVATVAGTLVLGGSAGRGGEGGVGADGTETSCCGYANWHGPGGSGGDGGNSGEVVLVLSDDGSVELVGSLLSGGTLAEGGSGGTGGDANSGTCETTCTYSSGVPATKLAYGGAGGDAGSASTWYGVRGAASAWGTSIVGPTAILGVSDGGSVGAASTCCSGAAYPYCYGDSSASSGASADGTTLTAFEDTVSTSATTLIGNRVLIQESDVGGGWGSIVAGVPFSPSAVTGLSLDAATVSRNVVSIVTVGTGTGIVATGTVTGHSNLVEILGTDDAVGMHLDGASCLVVNSTVVLDGAGTGIWTSGSTMVGLLNNIVQTGAGGTCLEDETSTRGYMRNNLVYGCTNQLYHDSAGYRTRAVELNFLTVTGSAGGHLYTSPGFTDSAGSDYSLTTSSSAVNAGYTVSSSTFGSVTDDLVGTSRPSGSAYDIGAYEQ